MVTKLNNKQSHEELIHYDNFVEIPHIGFVGGVWLIWTTNNIIDIKQIKTDMVPVTSDVDKDGSLLMFMDTRDH